MEGLVVRPVPGKGRGVFADRDFDQGELIERCPVVVIPPEQWRHYAATVIADYGFRWRQPVGSVAMPLGHGCLFNHSGEPNARFVTNVEEQAIDFLALAPIKPGDEITFHYGWRRGRVPSWYEDPQEVTQQAPRFRVSPGLAVATLGGVAALTGAVVVGGVVAVARRARRAARRGASASLRRSM